MRVVWSRSAHDQLRAISEYIAQSSPKYAADMAHRITRRSQQIADFPLSGRVVPEFRNERVREIIEGVYRIVYHVRVDCVEVLAVLHGARNVLGEEHSAGDEANR